MRIGIYGGTFDPVHFGHLLLAERCCEACQLDRIDFLPAGNPPHKLGKPISSANDRLRMLELAIADNPRMCIDDRELSAKEPCYTVTTLLQRRNEQPHDELYFLMGSDSLADFPRWKEPERILQLAQLVVVRRGGDTKTKTAQIIAQLGPRVADRIILVDIPANEISSSEIRQRIRQKQTVKYMVPPAVEEYLKSMNFGH